MNSTPSGALLSCFINLQQDPPQGSALLTIRNNSSIKEMEDNFMWNGISAELLPLYIEGLNYWWHVLKYGTPVNIIGLVCNGSQVNMTTTCSLFLVYCKQIMMAQN
jgi:hypothetical protein